MMEVGEERGEDGSVRGGGRRVMKEKGEMEEVELDEDLVVETRDVERGQVVDGGKQVGW